MTDLCPFLNQVIAAHGVSRDFGPLKKSPITPPGARNSSVVETVTPVGHQYEAVCGEWRSLTLIFCLFRALQNLLI